MAAGLDVAGLVAGITSLCFEMFEGCVYAYRFTHDVRHMGKDGDLLETRFQAERYRLVQWASKCGIADNHPNAKLNWTLVSQVLDQQLQMLTSAELLRTKYGIDVAEEPVRDEQDYEKRLCQDGGDTQQGLSRLLRKLRPELWTRPNSSTYRVKQLSQMSLSSTQAVGLGKKLKWAAIGKERLSRIIDDLGRLNGELERQLDSIDRDWLQGTMLLLLREILSRAPSLDGVSDFVELSRPLLPSEDQSLLATASIKRLRLYLGVDRRADELRTVYTPRVVGSIPSLRSIKLKRITFDSEPSYTGSAFAALDKRKVLVEWRVTPLTQVKAFETSMKKFAMLLKDADPSFATLSCKGLTVVDEPERKCFGMVYELPHVNALASDETGCQQRSLFDALASDSQCAVSERLYMASRLADAVCQFHTAGWLHKNIRSQNVIFFANSAPHQTTLEWSEPYLLGHENIRPDSA